jgi:uncharacterized membrane protein
MNVSTSWLIYILVTVIVYVILRFVAKKLITPVKLMIAFLVGAFAVFLSAPTLDVETRNDRLMMGGLFIVAYLAPIIVGLYIIWKGGYFNETLCVIPEKSPRK